MNGVKHLIADMQSSIIDPSLHSGWQTFLLSYFLILISWF